MQSAALLLAKSKSDRLPGKNILDYKGKPMFMENTAKCLKLFDKVYVSSDSQIILDQARSMGAIPIWRGNKLCGNCPNIPVYQHALQKMTDVDIVVAVQVNSPNISPRTILIVKELMEKGCTEVMTCASDYSIYGSVWAITRKKIMAYGDPYNPKPEVLVVDPSIDIHTWDDYEKALDIAACG